MKPTTTFAAIFIVVALTGCDQMEKVASGYGDDTSSNRSTNTGTANNDGDAGDTTDVAAADGDGELTKIRLDAFQHFQCTDNWTNRDGGWGLQAGTGNGKCTASFPGRSGRYRVILMAQLEFDGSPKYRISINGSQIAAGEYPASKGKLICDCPNWRTNCPDRVVPLDAGRHAINRGDVIEFYAEEVYPCGENHGAYAKWRELVFTPE